MHTIEKKEITNKIQYQWIETKTMKIVYFDDGRDID